MIGQLQPFWRDSLERFGVDLALVPTGSAFAHELLREPGWRLLDCDATAALLQKRKGEAQSQAADSLLGNCFDRTTLQ
jgi:hypothetical protein